MTALSFEVALARAEVYAAVPTLALRLRITESTGTPIHALALRVQVQIEPRRRRYTGPESERLVDLFGAPERYGDTLKNLLWTHVQLVLPGFQDAVEVDLPITCTYDFEVASAKYFESLEGGEIPLLLLFSGTVFVKGDSGFSVEQVPWEKEARYALPVAVWREVMERYFPGSAWIRLRKDSFEALHRFKSAQGLPTWEAALSALLEGAEEKKPV
jgi:hypothetical protein